MEFLRHVGQFFTCNPAQIMTGSFQVKLMWFPFVLYRILFSHMSDWWDPKVPQQARDRLGQGMCLCIPVLLAFISQLVLFAQINLPFRLRRTGTQRLNIYPEGQLPY